MKTRYPTERDLLDALRARELQRTAKQSKPLASAKRGAEKPPCFHHFG